MKTIHFLYSFIVISLICSITILIKMNKDINLITSRFDVKSKKIEVLAHENRLLKRTLLVELEKSKKEAEYY